MWFNFLLLFNNNLFVNDLIINSSRIVGKEALNFMLIGINKQVVKYFYLDLITLNISLNNLSIKNLYLPNIYNLETFYHAQVPANFIFFTFRLNNFYLLIFNFFFFFKLSIIFFTKLLQFNIYIYIIYIFKILKIKNLNYLFGFLKRKSFKFIKKKKKFKIKKFNKKFKFKKILKMRLNFLKNFK